jgi:hypothetical protein
MDEHRAARGVTGILDREHPAIRGVNDPIQDKLPWSGRPAIAAGTDYRP